MCPVFRFLGAARQTSSHRNASGVRACLFREAEAGGDSIVRSWLKRRGGGRKGARSTEPGGGGGAGLFEGVKQALGEEGGPSGARRKAVLGEKVWRGFPGEAAGGVAPGGPGHLDAGGMERAGWARAQGLRDQGHEAPPSCPPAEGASRRMWCP